MKTYLLPLLALLALTQCKKKPDPTPVPPNPVDLLPPPTQTGLSTFGCVLNGQAWNLAGSPFGGPRLSTEYYNNRLRLSASGMSNSSGGVLQILIDDITTSGRYTLSRRDTSAVRYATADVNCTYYTSSQHPANVVVTKLDLVNRIVSGTFFFTLEQPGCGRVVVTDGRFDSRF